MMNMHVSALYLKNEHALQDDRAGQAQLLCYPLTGRDEGGGRQRWLFCDSVDDWRQTDLNSGWMCNLFVHGLVGMESWEGGQMERRGIKLNFRDTRREFGNSYRVRLYSAIDSLVPWILLKNKAKFYLFDIQSVKNKTTGQFIVILKGLTFVVENSFLKEKANFIATGDKIVSISLQVRTGLA